MESYDIIRGMIGDPNMANLSPKNSNHCSEGCFFTKLGARIDHGIYRAMSFFRQARLTYSLINTDYIKIIRSHKLSKLLPPSLVILMIFLVAIPIFTERIINNDMALLWRSDITESDNTNPDDAIFSPVLLADGKEVTQDIPDIESIDRISSIGVLVGTYARYNDADYEFTLKRGDEVINTQVISARFIRDNSYYNFEFEPVELDKDSQYSFTLRALKTSDDNAIAYYLNGPTGRIAYSLSDRSDFYPFVVVMILVALAIFFLANLAINSNRTSHDAKILICMSLYTVSLVFIYPVFTIPDEPYHFISALRVAEYNWQESPGWNLSSNEHNLPSNSTCLADYYNGMNSSDPSTLEDITSCFLSAPHEIAAYVGAVPTSRIVAYLPSALGIMFGDLISDSPMVIFYCGRIFNLLTVGAILVYALSLVKKHRMILLAVIFIPMFLQQSISYSYDSILHALCILVIAYGIRLLTTKHKIRKRDFAIIAVALIIIGIIKIPYILVGTPLLFIKSEKFGKRKYQKWLILFALLLIVSLGFIASGCIEAIGAGNIVSDPDRGLPLSSIFIDPLGAIKRFARTLLQLKEFYIASTIGFFGWFNFSLDHIIIYMYIAFLVIVVLSDSEAHLSRAFRCCTMLAVIALIGSFFLVMYLKWTPQTSDIIEGVQGRYFLMAIPLVALVCLPKQKKLNIAPDSCYAFMNLTTFCYIMTLLIGFY